jgi:hypothetical protein
MDIYRIPFPEGFLEKSLGEIRMEFIILKNQFSILEKIFEKHGIDYKSDKLWMDENGHQHWLEK